MLRRLSLSALALGGLLMAMAMAPVNSKCPMSGQPVSNAITTTMHGAEIGFCCNGCKSRFANLDHGAQHQKVDAVMAKQQASAGKSPSASEMLTLNTAYLLPTCPVSGRPLSSAKAPVTKDPGQLFSLEEIQAMPPAQRGAAARNVTFCCNGCVDTFKGDPATYITKMNAEITARQLPTYPLDVCLASGRPLNVKGTATDRVFMNQLMRFCCGGCADVVLKFDPTDPGAGGARWMSAQRKLEAAYVDQQMPTYPLKTCVISGNPLGAKTVNLVEGDTLVRICCPGCEKGFNADPVKFIGVVQSARNKDDKAAS